MVKPQNFKSPNCVKLRSVDFNIMNTYKIKIVSQTNAIILVTFLLIVFIGGVFLFIPHGLSHFLAVTVTFVSMTITYFLWQHVVTGRTEWTVDSNGISITWVKQYSFATKADINLKWEEIESIGRVFDPNYYNLKIKLVSGQKFNFFHDTLTTRDDFKELIKALNQTFAESKATANSNVYKFVAGR
jgi:hypothetical protein